MNRWKLMMSLSFAAVALVACNDLPETAEEPVPPPLEDSIGTTNDKDTSTNEMEQSNEETETVHAYFAPDGSHLHYRGTGSEFAELDIQVHYIGDDYVALVESNGGSIFTTVYATEGDALIRVYREMTEFETTDAGEYGDFILPNVETLDQLKRETVVYRTGAAVGDTFEYDDATWTVIATDATVQTASETYDDVIHLQIVQETLTSDFYYKMGIGLIKHTDHMEVGEGEAPFIVDSELESITQQ